MSAIPHHLYRSRTWLDADGVWNWEVNRYTYRGALLTITYPAAKSGLSPWRWHARMQARMWVNRLESMRGLE